MDTIMNTLQTRQAPAMSLHSPPGPPYPPKTAALGGQPTKGLDIPVSSVFLAIFIVGAVCHMTILQVNLRRGHKFIMSGLMFGFCMARITAQVMRITWACYPRNISVAIAANVFVAAGVVLLFVVNLIFTQRIIRAGHPRSGWHPLFKNFFTAIYVLIVLTLIMLITAVIQSFFTLNKNTKRIDRDIQLYGQTFYAVISFLPIPLIIGGLLIPRKQRLEKFGSGRWREKIVILLASSVLLCLGASFRAGVNYAGGKRPNTHPASYQNKACFYIFNYTIETIVIFFYVIVRVDRRFYVPDGSKGPGDYSGKNTAKEHALTDGETGGDKLEQVISPEEETFDDMSPEEVARLAEEKKEKDLERGTSRVVEPTAETRSVTPNSSFHEDKA
ncbi:uncharacterized protein KY384_003911 [Bacidia gigantensis]|uniref:uncharacterized protein n=1 Tax=Bacidia gigantensis TaxID=2732470 RepID=UPI001D05844B|nr:uncharacterized protein KY384_003911 [Bacidia gigantensis]KAG8532270.1 hypothetical protein KY384_003911 [Bacidia gigantensis]